MSLFGTGSASVFGQPAQAQPQQQTASPAGSMFGQAAQLQAQQQQTGSPAGGVFGQATAAAQQQQSGGLFGQNQQSSASPGGGLFGQSQQPAASTGGGLFGQSQQPAASAGGGLFGQSQQPAASTGSGLFGQSQQPAASTGGGLFGQSQQPAASTGGGLFGQSQQPTAPTAGGLFGQAAAQNQPPSASRGGLFGLSAQPQQQQQQQQQPTSSLFTGSNTLQGAGSLFGAAAATAPSGTQFPQQMAGSFRGSQSAAATQPLQPSTQQPAGAYFDSLFAKTQREGAAPASDPTLHDLPSLELGLGDLRHRLRKLQSKTSEKPLDGKAHYLLAASGVDPAVAAKDLGLLDVPSARAERAHGYAPSEIDVETYLSNLQTKTTLSMISDGLEHSIRDFDSFLEDNVAMEWEAQRKRIYQHFGIKPRDVSASTRRESQGGFGRSRRSKAQGAPAARSSRSSALTGSIFQRSVIGAPTHVGSHASEFADVDPAPEASSGRSLGARGVAEDRALHEKQFKLCEKVRALNAARLAARPYPLLAELAAIELRSPEPHAPHVVEAYRAVIDIVGEDPDATAVLESGTARERQFAPMYLDENSNSAPSIEMRRRILQGSNRFLEKQFLREVESLIAKHPHDARLGGLPDTTSKIRAYVRLRAARKDLVPDNTELQQIQGEYIWAVVFYLLRCGHVNEAAEYVNDNSNQFRGIDRTFATYLNNYAASEDRRITNRKLLDRCTNEYVQRSRNAPENSIDPFRMACYKVIGRVELGNRSLDGLHTDVNDWIWLQFNLAREGDRSVEMAGESYGLAELQASIREIGLKHFPKAGSSSPEEAGSGSFGMYFYLQVLAGLFEDAVAYLYPFSYVDGVHFSLALTYYGLLRPSDPLTGPNDLRSYSVKQLSQINFGRMLGYYTRDFRAADVTSAVDYLVLICLNRDLGGEAGRRQASLCHEALRELVLETREFSKLIGDIRPDGRCIRGIIEERGPLIGLDDEEDFVGTVTLQAASFADDNGRTTDAALLYHLAGEYDTVVAIVSRALSEAVSLDIGEDPARLLPVKPRTTMAHGRDAGSGFGSGSDPTGTAATASKQDEQGGSLSLASIDDAVELAKTMMAMYERDAMFYRKIQEQNKVACRVLLEMSSIKKLVEAGQWAQGLDKIRALEILPLDAAGDASTIRAYASRFSALAPAVSINVPNLLMWTIACCVRQREQLSNGQFSGNEGTRRLMVRQLKQMTLDLTTYTSQLRYRFPPHLHEALARATAE